MNPEGDQEKYRELDEQQGSLRMSLIDIFGPWLSGKWPDEDKQRLDEIVAERDKYKLNLDCDHCGGMGFP